MSRFLGVMVVLATTMTTAAAAQQDDASMRTVRYYRADDHQTRVMAFIEVPYALMQPAAASAEPMMVYSVSANVLDSSGLALLPGGPQVWTQRVPASAQVPGAVGLELMEFKVAPGRYRMEVTITDSVSGRSTQTQSEVIGYPSMPAASDLLLSPAMRVENDGDTVPRAGEIRRGTTLLVPAVNLRLTPLRATAYYFLEAYTTSSEEETGTMQVAIVGSDGNTVLRTAASAVRLAPGGGVLKGQVDLDGLPAGDYTLDVIVTAAGESTTRSAAFSMAGLQETLAQAQAEPAAVARPSMVSDEAFFASLDEPALDSLEEPLSLIANSRELRNYDQLSVSAKRRFLADFWAKLDQTPETARNEDRERFYGAIAYANQQFKVGLGTQEPGWKSDRGRIYVKYGAADDKLRRVPSGEAPPYEVWRFTRGRSRYFVFADLTGFGAFKLIQTNDTRETGLPNWREIITEDGVRDVGYFLGVDFYGSSGTGF